MLNNNDKLYKLIQDLYEFFIIIDDHAWIKIIDEKIKDYKKVKTKKEFNDFCNQFTKLFKGMGGLVDLYISEINNHKLINEEDRKKKTKYYNNLIHEIYLIVSKC